MFEGSNYPNEVNAAVKQIGEIFISNILREPFDYTEWRNDKFDDMSLDELKVAAEYSAKLHSNEK